MGTLGRQAASELGLSSRDHSNMAKACAEARGSMVECSRFDHVGVTFLLPGGQTVDLYRSIAKFWQWRTRDRCSPIRSSSVWWWSWKHNPFDGYRRLDSGCAPGGGLDGLWKLMDRIAFLSVRYGGPPASLFVLALAPPLASKFDRTMRLLIT